ncbi:MAG: phenylalanine--tRNA ligase beta subunit-related protein [Sporolactobacillus sp.]
MRLTIEIALSDSLKKHVSDLQIGIAVYNHVTVSKLPEQIAERLPLFYQHIQLSLEREPIAAIDGVKEWRSIFKRVGTDPSRYRPSQESLLRKIKRDGAPHQVNSAVDLNNFFSVRHGIPLGIYDQSALQPPIELRIGTEADCYEALNGRSVQMAGKLLSSDRAGAFGSPIVDSVRTCVSENTTAALQIIYLQRSMAADEAEHIIKSIAELFVRVHGGSSETSIIR